MEQQIKELKKLIEGSEQIFITSHISPDPDALASVLLLGTTLKRNYPKKVVVMALEEEPEGLDFLTGYNDINFGNLNTTLTSTKPELFIMLDAVNYERCSRTDGGKIRQYLDTNDVNTAIIDHHEPTGRDDTDVYIHQGSPATVQDVYEVLFYHIKLPKPDGYAQTTMLGIYSDTSAFRYLSKRYETTLKIVDELLDAGVNIEDLAYKLNRYTRDQMRVFAELAKNVTHQDDYTYSFINDESIGQWLEQGNSMASLNTAAGFFVNDFVRNIDDRKWGFLAYLNPLAGKSIYSVSLRSRPDVKDVSLIANKLGGGGHKPAAGAKIQAKSLEEAIQFVQEAIRDSKNK